MSTPQNRDRKQKESLCESPERHACGRPEVMPESCPIVAHVERSAENPGGPGPTRRIPLVDDGAIDPDDRMARVGNAKKEIRILAAAQPQILVEPAHDLIQDLGPKEHVARRYRCPARAARASVSLEKSALHHPGGHVTLEHGQHGSGHDPRSIP